MQNNKPNSEIIIYKGDSGQPNIEVHVEGETVWLTQALLAELFNTSRPNVTMHIKNIFEELELDDKAVCQDFLHTAKDGKKYNTKYYNLDLIISLGYRVKSRIATRFRQWATVRLPPLCFIQSSKHLSNVGLLASNMGGIVRAVAIYLMNDFF